MRKSEIKKKVETFKNSEYVLLRDVEVCEAKTKSKDTHTFAPFAISTECYLYLMNQDGYVFKTINRSGRGFKWQAGVRMQETSFITKINTNVRKHKKRMSEIKHTIIRL